MATLRHGLLFGILALTLIGCAPKEEPATTSDATTTAAMSSLDHVAKAAPAVLYFVKPDCGSNPAAMPLIKRIYEANKDAGKFYVVMSTDQAGADQWAKQWQTDFPIIPDPEKKIIKQYGIQSSQTGIQVDASLKETDRFPGYGKNALVALNDSLGGGTVDLADAPNAGAG